jgi:hypothetical protein
MKNYCGEFSVFLDKNNFLGKGMFSKAYRIGEKVIVLTSDMSKECIAIFCQGENPHIPKMERLDDINGKDCYLMPYYKPLKASEKEAWKQYKALKEAIDSVPYQERQKYTCFAGYKKAILDCPSISWNLKEACLCIVENMQSYTDCIFLEISPRNAKVDENGKLILLDIVGISDELEKMRKKKKERFF